MRQKSDSIGLLKKVISNRTAAFECKQYQPSSVDITHQFQWLFYCHANDKCERNGKYGIAFSAVTFKCLR